MREGHQKPGGSWEQASIPQVFTLHSAPVHQTFCIRLLLSSLQLFRNINVIKVSVVASMRHLGGACMAGTLRYIMYVLVGVDFWLSRLAFELTHVRNAYCT